MFLYLTKNSLQINKDGGTIVITDNESKVTRKIPFNTIEGVVVFGRIQLTTDVLTSFLKAKTPVFFLSKGGGYFGKLDSLEIKNIDLLYNHIKYSMDSEISLYYTKVLISGKINNSIAMLYRWNRFYDKKFVENINLEEIIIKLKEYKEKVENANSKDEIRGYEGNASKIYFKGFNLFLKEPFHFTKRTRRPPLDDVNAMLSLGYTLLAQTIQMILSIHGIESQIGFFHEPKDLRSLLVLDMMELYRSWIIDDMVVRISQKESMTLEHFFINTTNEERPVLINDEGLKIFLNEYYKTVFSKADEENLGNFKKLTMIEKNLEIFKQSIVKNDFKIYESFKIK